MVRLVAATFQPLSFLLFLSLKKKTLWKKSEEKETVRDRMERRRHPNVCEVGKRVRVCSTERGREEGSDRGGGGGGERQLCNGVRGGNLGDAE